MLKLNSPGLMVSSILSLPLSSHLTPAFINLLPVSALLLLSLLKMHADPAAVCHHYNFAVRCHALVRRDFAWIITRLDLRLVSKHRGVTDFYRGVHKGTPAKLTYPRARPPHQPPTNTLSTEM